MTDKTYDCKEYHFDYPADGIIFEIPRSDGGKDVRFQNKEDNATAIWIEIEPVTGKGTAEEYAKAAFQDRVDAAKDAVDVAPYELKDAKEKGWRLRKWMVDGGKLPGIFEYAYLGGKGRMYRIYYYAPVKLFYSGQKPFNQIVETFTIK
jgi:hypothetical protein